MNFGNLGSTWTYGKWVKFDAWKVTFKGKDCTLAKTALTKAKWMLITHLERTFSEDEIKWSRNTSQPRAQPASLLAFLRLKVRLQMGPHTTCPDISESVNIHLGTLGPNFHLFVSGVCSQQPGDSLTLKLKIPLQPHTSLFWLRFLDSSQTTASQIGGRRKYNCSGSLALPRPPLWAIWSGQRWTKGSNFECWEQACDVSSPHTNLVLSAQHLLARRGPVWFKQLSSMIPLGSIFGHTCKKHYETENTFRKKSLGFCLFLWSKDSSDSSHPWMMLLVKVGYGFTTFLGYDAVEGRDVSDSWPLISLLMEIPPSMIL